MRRKRKRRLSNARRKISVSWLSNENKMTELRKLQKPKKLLKLKKLPSLNK